MRHVILVVWLSFSVLGAVDAAAAEVPSKPPVRSNHSSSIVQGATPPRVAVIGEESFVRVDPARALGNPAASVAIVEFADYQCPYCRRFHLETLPKIEADYIKTGKARYFYIDFPLPMHAHAFDAAVAARCAAMQGKYRRMQDLLYTEQARLGNELYDRLAANIGLNVEQFRACRNSEPAQQGVRRDFDEARRLGISATPTFVLGYVEGDRVVVKRTAVGAPALDRFEKEIEELRR